jgi:glucosamine--fructose-6-phosphate aminotransferase (isomerizing)
MGASLFASMSLEYFLCSIGINAVTIEAGELLHYQVKAHRDAVFLVVSRSGESVEIIRLLEILRGHQPVIAVTNEPESSLSRSADIDINVASLQDEMVAIQTYTGTVLALYLLGSAVDGSLADTQRKIEKLLPEFALLIEENMKDLTPWEGFLQPGVATYLLARGSSCASAWEGALLFHEAAKNSAVAMSAASFRHGPVEVVDESFRGLIFVPRDDTRDLNLALAQDLIRFGGHVRAIGPPLKDAQAISWCAIPDVPGMLAPLFEIVPLQAAALRLAQLRGIEPGSFRYATKVTVDEAGLRPHQASS